MQFASKNKWFYRRSLKPSKRIKLGFNNLFVFPNKYGLYWIFSSLLIYILGTNLEVNITILISYLMIVILIINLFLTHFNLHGLELHSSKQNISFAKTKIKYYINLKSSFARNNIKLKFINEDFKPLHLIKTNGEISEYIYINEKHRGIFDPGIIYGKSSAPMSLFNCWFYWRPFNKIIVAPNYKSHLEYFNYKSHSKEEKLSKNRSVFHDELVNLKNYIKGEKLSSINWKSYAKSNKLTTKEFINYVSNTKLLKLRKDYPLEESLEYLCFEIKEEYKKGNTYGVEMKKDIFINPSEGYTHYQSCLTLLAGYVE